MKRICQLLIGLCVLSFWNVAAFAVDAPQYNEGEKWVIQYTRSSPTSRSDMWPSGIYCIAYRGGNFQWYTADCDTGKPIATGLVNDLPIFGGSYAFGQDGKDVVPYLKFPLEVGKVPRQYSYFNPKSGPRGVNLDGSIKVEKIERIEVKAGSFDAYKHLLEEGRKQAARSYVYYYAPVCKCVAKLTTEFASGSSHSVELLSYTAP
jgi:hypothetical protein